MPTRRHPVTAPLAMGLILASGLVPALSSGQALANGRSRAPISLDSGQSGMIPTANRTRSVAPTGHDGRANVDDPSDINKKRSSSTITTD